MPGKSIDDKTIWTTNETTRPIWSVSDGKPNHPA